MLHAVPRHAQFAWLRVSLLAGTGPSRKQVPVHVTPPLRWPLCLFCLSLLRLPHFSFTLSLFRPFTILLLDPWSFSAPLCVIPPR